MDAQSTIFPTRNHDHEQCIAHALSQAASICAERGSRLTKLRKQVLEIIWQSHQPLGAYAILTTLSELNERPTAPPTVYRALEFLLEQGLAHRIASLNAFVGCVRPGHQGNGHFLICAGCGAAAELENKAVEKAISQCARDKGFVVRHHTVEISGLCPDCQ